MCVEFILWLTGLHSSLVLSVCVFEEGEVGEEFG